MGKRLRISDNSSSDGMTTVFAVYNGLFDSERNGKTI